MGIPKSKLVSLLRDNPSAFRAIAKRRGWTLEKAPPQGRPVSLRCAAPVAPTTGGAFTLVIPLETPSLNVWQRWHWAKRDRVKQAWEVLVRQQARKVGCPICYAGVYKMRVSVTSYRFALLDAEDNFRGGLKPLFDALRDVGVIWDDGPEWLEAGEIKQIVDRKNRRTEITVEQV